MCPIHVCFYFQSVSNGVKCGASCSCENCGNQPAQQGPPQLMGVDTLATAARVVAAMPTSRDSVQSFDRLETVISDETSRPPSEPSFSSKASIIDDDSSKGTLATASSKMDFLATLATNALDDMKNSRNDEYASVNHKRKADQISAPTYDDNYYRHHPGPPSSHRSYYDHLPPSLQHNPAYNRYSHRPYAHYPSPAHAHGGYNPRSQTINVVPQFHREEPFAGQSNRHSNKIKLPPGVSFRKICSHCGRQRAEHADFGFGSKCRMNTCGRCGADEDTHKNHNVMMGFHCTLSAENGADSGASAKYDATLNDLSARADVQKHRLDCNN